MALRNLPPPHIPVVDPDKHQGTRGWREYWESLDRWVRNIGAGAEATLVFAVSGGGFPISTGPQDDLLIPFDCEILEWTLLANQTGSIVIDIWSKAYASYPPTNADSITASAPPTISASTKAQSSTLTGWTKEIPAGNSLRINVDSVTSIQRFTLSLRVAKK